MHGEGGGEKKNGRHNRNLWLPRSVSKQKEGKEKREKKSWLRLRLVNRSV